MRLLDQLFMTTEGIFGIPLSVSAAYVLIFVLFGSFMECTGTGQLFMDFALSLTGHTAGGPGKVSLRQLGLFGTISGSAVANVMVDGPITIPLMKRSGFPGAFCRGRRGGRLHRRPDHAADHGRRCVRHGRVPRRVLHAGHHLGADSFRSFTTSPVSRPYISRPSGEVFSACRAPNCRASPSVRRTRSSFHSRPDHPRA